MEKKLKKNFLIKAIIHAKITKELHNQRLEYLMNLEKKEKHNHSIHRERDNFNNMLHNAQCIRTKEFTPIVHYYFHRFCIFCLIVYHLCNRTENH